MFYKKIKYTLYMLKLRLKGFKYNSILRNSGEDAARLYVHDKALEWSKYTMDTIGVDLVVEGIENIPDGPCVFIGNHSSILDIPILLLTSKKQMGFIAKKELATAPIIGYWISKSGSVFIDREDVRSAIKSIGQGVENIRNGHSMAIFPEGTRSKNGQVGDFKKGSLKLATKAKAPIVPVSIERASRCYEDTKSFQPASIKVVYGAPIYTDNLSKEEESSLATTIRDIVVSNIPK